MPHSRRHFLKCTLAVTASLTVPAPARAQQSTVRTIAGTGIAGYEFEGETGLVATTTPINNPYGVVIGPDGNLYFCEVDSGRIRCLSLSTGVLFTVAGNGEKAYAGDGRPATEASFSAPHEIRFDSYGNLFVVERDSHVIRRIDARVGLVTTVAGTGEPGFDGDNGRATLAQLRQPHSIAFDASGNLLICDIGNHRVRRINMGSGVLETVSGTGEALPTPDSAAILGTPLRGPRSIDTDRSGKAYLVLREGNAVFQLDFSAGRMQRIAGTGERGYSGDGGPGLNATFNGPKGIAYSADDNSLYIVDTENHVIRRLSLDDGIISTVLGDGQRADGKDGDPLACSLNRPHGVFMHERVLYVTDSENHRIRAVEGLIRSI